MVLLDLEIYKKTVNNDYIFYNYNKKLLNRFELIKNKIAHIINREKVLNCFENKNTLDLSKDDYNKLSESIKNNKEWIELFQEILNLHNIKCDLADAIENLYLPTWNEIVTNTNYNYNNKKLNINFASSHSYIGVLLRKGLVPGNKFNPSIIIGILHNNNSIVIGERGGQSYSKRYMVIPAGTINFCFGDKNLLSKTVYRELKEELNQDLVDIKNFSLVANIKDNYNLKLSCFTFILESKLHDKEINDKWKNSRDSSEHNRLIFIPYNEKALTKFLEENTKNSLEKGLLPVATAALTTLGYHKFGKKWYDEMLAKLNSKTDLISYKEIDF